MSSDFILFGYLISLFPVIYSVFGLKKHKERNLAIVFFLLLGVGIFFNLFAGILLRVSEFTGLTHLETRKIVAPFRIFEVFLAWIYFAVFKFLEK